MGGTTSSSGYVVGNQPDMVATHSVEESRMASKVNRKSKITKCSESVEEKQHIHFAGLIPPH